MLGQMTDATVGLVVPMGIFGAHGQVFGLVDETGTQATGIHLLETDDVVAAHQLGDAVQVFEQLRVRQQVFPTVGEVVMRTMGGDGHLDVVAEQTEIASRLGLFISLHARSSPLFLHRIIGDSDWTDHLPQSFGELEIFTVIHGTVDDAHGIVREGGF